MGEVESARQVLHQAASDHKGNTEYHLLDSRIASQELDVDRAVSALDRALELFRKESNDLKIRETVLTKVAILADFKRYDQCVATLQKYLKSEPTDEIAYYFLGKIHSVFQNREESKKAYRRALSLRPGFSAASRALGLQLELEGRLKDALAIYERAAESGSADEELFQKLINLSLILEDYSTALKYLNNYLLLKPEDTQAQLRVGLIQFKLKNYDDAKRVFENLLKTSDVAEDRIRFYLGSVYEEVSDFERAIDNYLLVKSESDYYAEARIQASYLFDKKILKPEVALTSLKEAVDVKPENADIVIALANQYDSMKKFKEAASLLKSANERFKDHEKILFLLGVLEEKIDDQDASVKTMKMVLAVNPNNPHALNHIGYSYVQRNINLAEAETLLKRAVQIAPDNGFIIDSLGWMYFKMGQYKKAAQYLEKANKLAPGQIVILEHLADSYKKLGREKEALAVYRQIMGWSARENETAEVKPPDAETQAVQERVKTKIASIDPQAPN